MSLWKNDKELFQIAREELFCALVGDILDTMGLQNQFVSRQVKPVSDDMVVIGRAKTVLECDVKDITLEGHHDPLISQPFGLMFKALDSLKENEVYICTGASYDYACWGGLMSTRAMHLKAAGAVVNGCHRDSNEILRLQFPSFSIGAYAQDQGPRGKVVDFDCKIDFGDIEVYPGDVIFGDRDGVLVIPDGAVKEAFSGAIEKARGEKTVLKALQQGMSTQEAFDTFGIM